MAIEYKVTSKRSGRTINFDGAGDKLKISWTIEYDVQSVDSEKANYFDHDVSEFSVVTAPGLPIVNRSVYSFKGKIIPFVICRKKSAKQSKKNAAHWVVTCDFDSGDANNRNESDDVPQNPPEALTDITPRVEPSVERIERVLYKDKSEVTDGNPGGNKWVMTPTRNFYSDPVMESLSVLVLKITQYESSITYEQMADRHFVVNKTAYRGSGRYFWFIESVEATEVDVVLVGGSTAAALVTYTLKRSPKTQGWKEERTLIDSHYFVVDSEDAFKLDSQSRRIKRAFTDDQAFSQTMGLVDKDGKRKTGIVPDYEYFEAFEAVEFKVAEAGGFLQV